MPKELDVRLESLGYTARYARPVFKLWGAGGVIVRRLYDALSPYGVTLANIQLIANGANAEQPVLTASIRGNTTVKFGFGHLEFVMNNPDREAFELTPRLFEDSTGWIREEVPDFKFSQHNFGYHCHAFVKGSTTKDVLDGINPHFVKAAGSSLGNGAILHCSLPELNWNTQVWFDHSIPVPGALYIALMIETRTETLDYVKTMQDGRAYFEAVLDELGLRLPENP
jgi:hypothetical protein